MACGSTNSFLFCLAGIHLFKEKKYSFNKESPSRARNTIGQSSMWKSATSSAQLSWALTGSCTSPVSQRAYRHRASRNNWYNQNNATKCYSASPHKVTCLHYIEQECTTTGMHNRSLSAEHWNFLLAFLGHTLVSLVSQFEMSRLI